MIDSWNGFSTLFRRLVMKHTIKIPDQSGADLDTLRGLFQDRNFALFAGMLGALFFLFILGAKTQWGSTRFPAIATCVPARQSGPCSSLSRS